MRRILAFPIKAQLAAKPLRIPLSGGCSIRSMPRFLSTDEKSPDLGLDFELDLGEDQVLKPEDLMEGTASPRRPLSQQSQQRKLPAKAALRSANPPWIRSAERQGAAAERQEEFPGILDRNNPPIMSVEHFKMLREVRAERTALGKRARRSVGGGLSEFDIEAAFGNNDGNLPSEIKTTGANEPFEEATDTEDRVQDRVEGETAAEAESAMRLSSELRDMDRDFEWSSPVSNNRPGASCIFCKPDLSTHGVFKLAYTNVELLHRFVNKRGMITNRATNGNCARHQRKVSRAVKQARVIGLLNADSDWKVPLDFLYGANAVKFQRFPKSTSLVAGEVSEDADAGTEGEPFEVTQPQA